MAASEDLMSLWAASLSSVDRCLEATYKKGGTFVNAGPTSTQHPPTLYAVKPTASPAASSARSAPAAIDHQLAAVLDALKQRAAEHPQSFVPSGMSGAGKSHTVFSALRHLAKGSPMQPQVDALITVVRSFTHAATRRNADSTRVGKMFSTVWGLYGDGPKMEGITVQPSFFERSRVTDCREGESSFHVFYQLLSTRDYQLRKRLRLLDDISEYTLLRGSSPAGGASQGFEALLPALRTLGLRAEQVDTLLDVLSAVLLLGNLEFKNKYDEEDCSECSVLNPAVVEVAATLLRVEASELLEVLVKLDLPVRRAGGNETKPMMRPCSAGAAEAKLREFLRTVYARTVSWLFETINSLTMTPTQHKQPRGSVKLLDYCGHEDLADEVHGSCNGLDQLLINYVDEVVEGLFRSMTTEPHVLALRGDGLQELSGTSLEQAEQFSNVGSLRVMDSVKQGLFAIMNTRAITKGANDTQDFLREVLNKWQESGLVKHSPAGLQQSFFSFSHGAGALPVTYGAADMLQRNTERPNTVRRQMNSLMCDSSHTEVLPEIFPLEPTKDEPSTECAAVVRMMHELKGQLQDTHALFVRCVAPTLSEGSGAHQYSHEDIQTQLAYQQAPSWLSWQQRALTVHMPRETFQSQYSLLGPSASTLEELVATCNAQYLSPPDLIAQGTHEVHFSSSARDRLNAARDELQPAPTPPPPPASMPAIELQGYRQLLQEMDSAQQEASQGKLDAADSHIRTAVHLNRQRLDLLPAIYKDQQIQKAAAFDRDYLQEMVAQRHVIEMHFIKQLGKALEQLVGQFKTNLNEHKAFDHSMIEELVKQMRSLSAAAGQHEDRMKKELLLHQNSTIQQLRNKYSNQQVMDISAMLDEYTAELAQAQVEASQALLVLKQRLTKDQSEALDQLIRSEQSTRAAVNRTKLELICSPAVAQARAEVMAQEADRCQQWRLASTNTASLWDDTTGEYRLVKLTKLCNKVRESIYSDNYDEEISRISTLSNDTTLLIKQLDNDLFAHINAAQEQSDATAREHVMELAKEDTQVNKQREALLSAHLSQVDVRAAVQTAMRDLDTVLEEAAELHLAELEEGQQLSENTRQEEHDAQLTQLHHGLQVRQAQHEAEVRLSFERKLEQKEAEERLRSATAHAGLSDRLQSQKESLSAARAALQQSTQELSGASKSHALELSRRQCDEQVAVFKKHIASTLSTIQSHTSEQRHKWSHKLRLQLQSHMQAREVAVSDSFAQSVQHMQQLHESIQSRLEKSMVEQADSRSHLTRKEAQLDTELALAKAGLQELEEKLQQLNDGTHAKKAAHEHQLNEILLQHQKSVAEYVLSDNALGKATEAEVKLADGQRESKLELAAEAMLGDHVRCLDQMMSHREREMADKEAGASSSRAACKKEHTAAVKQIAMQGQQQLSQNEGTLAEYEAECTTRCGELVVGLQDMKALERSELLEADMSQFQESLRVEQERATIKDGAVREAEYRVVEKFERIIRELEASWQEESAAREEHVVSQLREQFEAHLSKVNQQTDRSIAQALETDEQVRFQHFGTIASLQTEEVSRMHEITSDISSEYNRLFEATKKDLLNTKSNALRRRRTASENAKVALAAKTQASCSKIVELQKAKHDYIQQTKDEYANLRSEHSTLREKLLHESEQLAYERAKHLEEKDAKLSEEALQMLTHVTDLWTMTELRRDRKRKEELEELERGEVAGQMANYVPTLGRLWSAMEVAEAQSNLFLEQAASTVEPSPAVISKFSTEMEKLATRMPVMQLVNRREELKSKLEAVKRTSSRPERLFSASSGQLLTREQDLAALCAELIELNKVLMVELPQYEHLFKERFGYQGKPYLAVVMAEHAQLEAQLQGATRPQ